MPDPRGVPIHGEFSSADASALSEANSRANLYGAGSVTALTLGASDQVRITDLVVASAGTNLTITVYDGADNTVDAGEIIWKGIVPTNTSQLSIGLMTAHYCLKGTYPKVKTSGAGQVDVSFKGLLIGL